MNSRFSDDTCEALHNLSLNGGPDDQYGDVSEAPGRWWGLMVDVTAAEMMETGMPADALGPDHPIHVILTEDSQGFVDYEQYDTADEARANFDRIVSELEAEMEQANA